MSEKKEIKSQRKKCPVCKKDFHNNKKWESKGQWNDIVYCSDLCRKRRKLK